MSSSSPSRSRARRALVISLLLAVSCAPVAARELPPIDALADAAPDRAATTRRFAAGPLANFRGHFEERLGVPSFLQANAGAVRLSGASLLLATDPVPFARGYLKSLGGEYRITPGEIDALPVAGVRRLPSGAAIVQFGHSVNGIEVFRERASVLIDADGALNSIGGYVTGAGAVADLPPQALFRHDPAAAIAAALADFGFDAGAVSGRLRQVDAREGYAYFALASKAATGATLGAPARSKPVFFRTLQGLVPAFYLEVAVTSPSGDEDDYAYVVSAKGGTVLWRRNLTAYDLFAYRVWAETSMPFLPYPGPSGRNGTPYPTASPDGYQAPFIAPNLLALQNGPISTNDPWLASGATQTRGNNVDAYADLAAPNGFSAGDLRATTTSGNTFDRVYDTAQGPQATTNQTLAAVTALFYLTNWLHDWYYDAGFDEAAGNAQSDNYGRGGLGGDPLLAEAQDYSGFDNANMTTPADGASPRMQVYIFKGRVTDQVVISGGANGTFLTGSAAFGPQAFDTVAELVLAADGTAPASDGCQALTNNVSGKIALIDRGSCTFKTKVLNAQNAGASGVLIANNTSGQPGLPEDGSIVTPITIPSLSVSLADGNTIKAGLGIGSVTAELQRVAGIDRDGAIDATIVAHEWGHYISNRLVPGGLGAFMAAGMGEGFADFHALLLQAKAGDAGNFSGIYTAAGYVFGGPSLAGDPNYGYYYGFRRYPYSTDHARNPLTFKHVADDVALPPSPPINPYLVFGLNSEAHDSGEVWASALWQCYAGLLADTLGATPRLSFAGAQARMKQYLVAGYQMTPVSPTFTEARDALLSAMLANDVDDFVACADGFADRGFGSGAVSPDRFSTDNVGVVESFSVDAAAQWIAPGSLGDVSGGTCDSDGSLDARESGVLLLTLRNSGLGGLDSPQLTLQSPGAAVTLPAAPVALPPLAPLATTTVPVKVTLGNLSGIQSVTIDYSIADPALAVPVAGQDVFEVNLDFSPGATDDFERPTLAWTPVLDLLADPAAAWSRASEAGLNHVAHGPDTGAKGRSMLVSPPLHVAPSGSFVITFKQRYDFEASDQFYDGGVIEISSDGGNTWKDVTQAGGVLTPAYDDTVYGAGENPLAGRAAYVGNSGPVLSAATLDFGTALQGQTVLLRFVVGTDAAAGAGGGWIDDVTAAGITNAPFTHRIADPGHCIFDKVFRDGFETP